VRSKKSVIYALVSKLKFVQDNSNHKVYTLHYRNRQIRTYLSHSKSKKHKDVVDHDLNLMASEMGINLGLFKSIIDCCKSFKEYVGASTKLVDIK